MNTPKILIADDEKDILDLLTYNLEKEGYEVIRARTGKEVIEKAKATTPDLFLLDIGMPEMDGIEVCYHLRQLPEFDQATIAFLTAKIEEYVEVAGFEAGADDFILKPIKPRALMARIRSLLGKNIRQSTANELRVHDLIISPDSYTVMRKGEEISLSKLEFDLLYFLASHSGKVFNRSQLLDKVWNSTIVMERTVDVHIRKLRKQLGEGYIDTIKGVGYKFRSDR